jgi:hypothetical protein
LIRVQRPDLGNDTEAQTSTLGIGRVVDSLLPAAAGVSEPNHYLNLANLPPNYIPTTAWQRACPGYRCPSRVL